MGALAGEMGEIPELGAELERLDAVLLALPDAPGASQSPELALRKALGIPTT